MFNIKLTQGIKIHIQSDIPMGCGMGSSAATILSIVHALANHLKIELPVETFFKLGLEAENMQHGFSSGLDVRVSLHGGCLYVQEDEMQTRAIPEIPMYLVNTGTPQSSTGECVAHAKNIFNATTIGDDFSAVTQNMDKALQRNDINEIMRAVYENQKLLTQIGVVPEHVQQFISAVSGFGGAAKICGAGSVKGDRAGMVLVITHDLSVLATLCSQYHYDIVPIAGETRGVHVV